MIYEYTDEMALTDGVLVDISSLDLAIDFNGRKVNRMATNLLEQISMKDKEGKWEIDKLYTQMYLAVGAAVDEEGDGYLYHGNMPGLGDSEVWFVKNEVDGYTVMLPEDY